VHHVKRLRLPRLEVDHARRWGSTVSHNNFDAACQLSSIIGGMRKGDARSKEKMYDGVVTEGMPMSYGRLLLGRPQ